MLTFSIFNFNKGINMAQPSKKVVLVTGANKGIGLETARQLGHKGFTTIIGARDKKRGEEAAAKLKAEGIDAHFQQLDVSQPKSISVAVESIQEKFKRLDVLVNNAGVLLDRDSSALDLKLETLVETMETNVYGPFLTIQRVLPLMKENGYGRIVNLSSALGSLTDMANPQSSMAGFDGAAYRLSKTAINAVTTIFAMKARGSNILVNSCCPGWVKTEMGGEGAQLPVEKGADTPVWLATLPDGGPSGGLFSERQLIAW
jgi:NAD(P)-dependent dehydrogenase (short-subunit alcohol dehydrogenase family)